MVSFWFPSQVALAFFQTFYQKISYSCRKKRGSNWRSRYVPLLHCRPKGSTPCSVQPNWIYPHFGRKHDECKLWTCETYDARRLKMGCSTHHRALVSLGFPFEAPTKLGKQDTPCLLRNLRFLGCPVPSEPCHTDISAVKTCILDFLVLKGWFIGDIPSFPAEHRQVETCSGQFQAPGAAYCSVSSFMVAKRLLLHRLR